MDHGAGLHSDVRHHDGRVELFLRGLAKTRECVIAIPTVDLLDRVVGIGTCSGADTDKFAKFKLTAVPGKSSRPP